MAALTPTPSQSPSDQSWTSAFALYKQQTHRDLASSPLLSNLHTIDDVLSQIEASHKTFGTWRSKHESVWGKLSGCIGPLEVLGDFKVIGGVGAVFGAVVYLVKACEEVETSYDLVETLFEEMAEFTVRLREYAKVEVGEAMRKKVVATLACMLEIIGRSEELIRTKRFRHFIGVTWVGKDEKTRDALDRFHKLIDSEERLVIAVTYSSVQNTEQNVSTLLSAADENKQSQKDVLGKMDQLSKAVTDSKEEELLEQTLWTQAVPKTREIFAEFKENLLEGTCEWLHDEFLFCNWEREEAPLMLVFGGPGAGKSFLATKTILFLRDRHDQGPEHHSRISVSYFFVKGDNQALHDLNVILKTIAYQIVQKDEIYRKYVISVCRSPEATNTAEKTWKVLFLDFYTSSLGAESSAFIVIDGLDEAPLYTRRKFLDLVKVLLNQAPGNHFLRPRLQIGIFGRPDLKDDMEFSRQKFVNVNGQKNSKDINDYILSRLPLVRVLKHMKPSARTKFAKEIRSTILQRADGMFLWAKLVLDQICRKERKSEVQQALQNAPRELDRMIRHIFERVAADPDVNIADLNKILSWVTCAKRPLKLGEMHLILKLPTGEPNLSLRRRLRGKFASFFNMSRRGREEEGEVGYETEESEEDVPGEKVEEAPLNFSNLSDDSNGDDNDGSDDEEKGEDESEGDQNVTSQKHEFAIDEKAKFEFRTIELSFSHKRIKDYLVQEGGSNPVFVPPEFPKMPIGIDLNESELDLALTCLSILVDGITEDEGEFGLTQYATENFMKHIGGIDRTKISQESKLKLQEQITKLFCDDIGLGKLLAPTFGEDKKTFEYRNKNVFYHTWISTNEYSKVLCECLGEIDNVDTNNFTACQLEWMKLSVSSVKEFYKPLMIALSKMWLSKSGFDDIGYLDKSQLHVLVLHGYFIMHDDGSRGDDNVEDLEDYSTRLRNIPLEDIRTYAEWAGLEKTAHWHVGLARTMMGWGYSDAAIEEFKKALEVDSVAWVAQEGLSLCYAGRNNAKLALEWMAKATENVPANLSFLVQDDFLPQVARWLSEIGDSERAIKAWKEVWENDIHSVYYLYKYICEMHKGRRYHDLVAVTMAANTFISRNKHCENLLIKLLATSPDDVFEAIGTAFDSIDAADDRATFLGACAMAITAADAIQAEINNSMPYTQMRMSVASFKYEYCDQTSEAIALWQQTIDLIHSFPVTGTAPSVVGCKEYDNTIWTFEFNAAVEVKKCTNLICQIHFDAAVEAKERGEDLAPLVDSLKNRARFETGLMANDFEYWIYNRGHANMTYGVWLRDYGGAEETIWRKCFQTALVPLTNMLVNEYLNYEQHAYFALGSSLLMANDMTNATAAFAVAMKGHEFIAKQLAAEAEGKITQVLRDAQGFPISRFPFDDGYVITCDGPCNTPESAYTSLHRCRVCDNIDLCGPCLELFRGKGFAKRMCNVRHEYFKTFPLPEGSEDLAVRVVEGRVKPREEWLNELRERHGGYIEEELEVGAK
ncbi:hypothetical protein VE03_09431 [Pseudogymnoascus sp. 23342-1-I1]|nr:hypothetical protein VE03_09431 [Pseudogymnoascus sp. 23342-1-I1]